MSDVVVDGVVMLVKLPLSLPDTALLSVLSVQPDILAASAAAANSFAMFLLIIFSPFLDFPKIA